MTGTLPLCEQLREARRRGRVARREEDAHVGPHGARRSYACARVEAAASRRRAARAAIPVACSSNCAHRLLAVARRDDAVAELRQRRRHQRAQRGLVLRHEDDLLPAQRRRARARRWCRASAMARRELRRLRQEHAERRALAGRALDVHEARRAAARCRTPSRGPRPVPSRLVVKNGSKMRARVASSMPTPVSLTTISANAPARAQGLRAHEGLVERPPRASPGAACPRRAWPGARSCTG